MNIEGGPFVNRKLSEKIIIKAVEVVLVAADSSILGSLTLLLLLLPRPTCKLKLRLYSELYQLALNSFAAF